MGRDSLVGAFLLLLSGWLYLYTGEIPHPPFIPLGPAFYPRIILGLLGFLSLCLIVADLWKRVERKHSPAQPGQRRSWLQEYGLVLPAFLLFGAYILFLPILGYLLATFLFVAILQWVLGLRQIKQLPTLFLVAGGASSLTYLIFERYLRILLPRGVLF